MKRNATTTKPKSRAEATTKSKRKSKHKPTYAFDTRVGSICQDIRRRRHELGLTLEHFAERCELSQNYIGAIETGHRDPSLASLLALANGLGIPPGEMFGPTSALSPEAIEMGRAFEKVAKNMQESVLAVLRATAIKVPSL